MSPLQLDLHKEPILPEYILSISAEIIFFLKCKCANIVRDRKC